MTSSARSRLARLARRGTATQTGTPPEARVVPVRVGDLAEVLEAAEKCMDDNEKEPQ